MVAVSSGVTPPLVRVRVVTPAVPAGAITGLESTGLVAPAAKRLVSEVSLTTLAGALVVLPVFVQAPWVRAAPMAAALFTAVLLAAGVLLERRPERGCQQVGALLVGFSGSWLGGALFWGWCRLHPAWHLPIEAFALPLAVAGLGGRWRLAGCFYLASLLGTAATDAAMLLSGVMELWPPVLSGPLAEAPALLQAAALSLFHPLPLAVISLTGLLLLTASAWLWPRGQAGRIAAVTLATTLAVDGLFLAAALSAPRLSGLI